MSDPGEIFDWNGAIVGFVVVIMLLTALLLGTRFVLFRPRDDDKK